MKHHLFLLGVIFATIFVWQDGPVETKEPSEKGTQSGSAGSCIACHTDYPKLQTLASPDEGPPMEGCGGAAPRIDPCDRVFLGGPGYEAFKKSAHGSLSCTECHGGMDGTTDKKQAHSGDFIKHPSKNAKTACGGCHDDIVKNATGSLHEQGWGQKRSVAMRMGHAKFDQLPEPLQTAYGQNCATCHGGCGDCHVNRPKAAGGGLYKGHQFSRTPDMRDTCVACHTSRGGHAYFGLGIGAQPDVHLMQAGYTCLDCHSQEQLHGDGRIYETRYRTPLSPKCQDCHDDVAESNTFHKEHVTTFDCHVCHSQDYNNCGSCHVGGAGARIPSYLGFKIGLNPIPQDKPYRLALLRRTLAAPDNWEIYGVKQMPAFDAKTTFNYTTPHNILRWTTRTQVEEGGSCFQNCHVIPEAAGLRNRELYLFSSDLKESWEKSANKNIVVDGKLPAGWEKP